MAITALQVGLPFLWCGAVLGISFLETPLKFRAPGITLRLGLGIGALVFRALNLVEFVLLVLLTATLLVAPHGLAVGLLAALWVLLVVQVLVVRRRLDRRTAQVIAGAELPRSRLHLAYIALEVAKIVVLLTLAVQALATAVA